MGQYYKAVNLDKKEWLYSHEYDNGLKLMEHSYIGNKFVQAVENLLIKGGAWYKNKIVWAGDYADGEEKDKEGENLYSIIGVDNNEIKPKSEELNEKYKYLCNHTEKMYVDRTKIKEIKGWEGTKINPLPLLTCEGNGRGGGDFRGEDMKIGLWSRNSISIESEVPEGYKEINGNFKEDN